MSAEPRDVGPIEGREVYKDAPPPPPPPRPAPSRGTVPPPPSARTAARSAPRPPGASPPPPGPSARPPRAAAQPPAVQDHRSAAARALDDIRHSRGRNVPNSRPLPEWVRKFAWFLDNSIPIPGTGGQRRVGVDGVISIVPVAGDVAGVVMSLSIVLAGVGAGVTIPTILRMLLNVGFEAIASLVPFGGVVFDMVFKSNMRNVRLIERDLADRRATRRSSIGVLLLSLAVVAIGVLMLVATTIAAAAVIWWILTKIF